MKPYVVCGALHYNEELYSTHWFAALYPYIDAFVIVDSYSTDNSLANIMALDTENKLVILKRKWDQNYSSARNTYLDYIKKNIYPKHRNDLYYLRSDQDEIYYGEWLEKALVLAEENPDVVGWRSNFYTFTDTHNLLDEKSPTETRVSLFKYFPDIKYEKNLHEWPVHTSNNQPLYASPFDDPRLGIQYVSGYAYLHFSWCDEKRCFKKAVNYTKIYVENGTETKGHLDSMTPSRDSWWWEKKSDIKFKGKLPSVFKKYGLLPGQENPTEEEDSKPKISVYTIIKNAIKFDYPIIEAVRSVLPFADEVIVNLGDSDDGTQGLLKKAFSGTVKVRFFERKWAGKESGTAFLRDESNFAKDQCANEIVMYLQSDECYLESDTEAILLVAKTLSERKDLVGARFKWHHFDGMPTYENKDSYPEEIRLFKKDLLESIGDAQSMGLKSANLVNAMNFKELLLDTSIYCFHYGWLRSPKKMLEKLQDFDSYYHDTEELNQMHVNDSVKFPDGKYNYGNKIPNFFSPHPYVMYPRIKKYEKENRNYCIGDAVFQY